MILKHALLTDFYMSRRRSRREREEGTRIPYQYILLHEQEQDKEEQEEEEEGREKDPQPMQTLLMDPNLTHPLTLLLLLLCLEKDGSHKKICSWTA